MGRHGQGKRFFLRQVVDGVEHKSPYEKVRAHEPLVEADFQQFYGIDYRDVYRPGGGQSRMTWRRCLALAEQLPMESRFKSELEDRYPMDMTTQQLYRLEQALTGKPSPMWTAKKRDRDAAEHKQAMKLARGRAREHNRRYLARRNQAKE